MKAGTETGYSYVIEHKPRGNGPKAGLGTVQWARIGREPKRYNCGKHGLLTRREIAKLAGVTEGAIHYRMKSGMKGAQLIEHTAPLRKRRTRMICKRPTLAIACKLATAFQGRIPTWREVNQVHPMSEQAAKNWARAMRDALEAA